MSESTVAPDNPIQFIRPDQTVPSERSKKWDISTITEVHVGGTLSKREARASLESHQFPIFEKEVSSLEEAKNQQALWKSLKEREIPTYSMFKIGTRTLPSGEKKYYTVTEDLTQNDTYYVISVNNIAPDRSIPDPEHRVYSSKLLFNTISEIPKPSKELLKTTVHTIAAEAAKPDQQGNVINLNYERGKGPNPLILIVNKTNLEDCRVIVGDLGFEDIRMDKDIDRAQDSNEYHAEEFISKMMIRN